MIVFDLDGCLIDSEEMIRQSYREAGAEPPANFLSLGHHDWIEEDREAVHARKNAAYLRGLRTGVPLLPPWHTAEMLAEQGHDVALLTGAPDGTVSVLEWYAPSLAWPFTEACSVPGPTAKAAWLAARPHGVYIDDQRHVAVPGGWRFVHYTGQNASELYAEVTG